MEQFYVGWGTLALINTNIAQAKGINAIAVFLFSLLFGPLITLFMLANNPKKQSPKNDDKKKNIEA